MSDYLRNDLRIRLEELGLRLPEVPKPQGHYVGVTVHNGIAYVSGQVSRLKDGVITGPVDDQTPANTIKLAAETCVLRALSVLTAIGDEYEFERVLFMRGYINAVPGFAAHSAVLDGASSLLHAIFGERGSHSRSAIGVASLPSSGLLEIELVVALTANPRREAGSASTETNSMPLTGDPS